MLFVTTATFLRNIAELLSVCYIKHNDSYDLIFGSLLFIFQSWNSWLILQNANEANLWKKWSISEDILKLNPKKIRRK